MKEAPPPNPDPIFAQLFAWKPTRAQDRQIKLLEAAIESLASDGIENTSLETIGKRVKMARSHIIYYFRSKEELLQKAIEYITTNAQQMTVAAVRGAGSPLDQLERYVEITFEWAQRYPLHAKVMILFYYLASHRSADAALNAKIRDSGRDRLGEIVRQIYPGRGKTRCDRIALGIQNLITGALFYAFGTGRERELDRLKEHTRLSCLGLLKEPREGG